MGCFITKNSFVAEEILKGKLQMAEHYVEVQFMEKRQSAELEA